MTSLWERRQAVDLALLVDQDGILDPHAKAAIRVIQPRLDGITWLGWSTSFE